MAVGQGFLGFGLVTVGVVASLATVLAFFGSTWWLFDSPPTSGLTWRSCLLHRRTRLCVVVLQGDWRCSSCSWRGQRNRASCRCTSALRRLRRATDSLTVVSFNVDQKASIRDSTAYGWISTVDPDIVVLTEATEAWTRVHRRTPAPYHYAQRSSDRQNLRDRCDGARESRCGAHAGNPGQGFSARIVASIGDQPIVIYAVQSRVASNEKDAATAAGVHRRGRQPCQRGDRSHHRCRRFPIEPMVAYLPNACSPMLISLTPS